MRKVSQSQDRQPSETCHPAGRMLLMEPEAVQHMHTPVQKQWYLDQDSEVPRTPGCPR